MTGERRIRHKPDEMSGRLKKFGLGFGLAVALGGAAVELSGNDDNHIDATVPKTSIKKGPEPKEQMDAKMNAREPDFNKAFDMPEGKPKNEDLDIENQSKRLCREVFEDAKAYLQGVSKNGVDATFDIKTVDEGDFPLIMEVKFGDRMVAQLSPQPNTRDAVSVLITESNDEELVRHVINVPLTELNDLIKRAVDNYPTTE